MEPKELTALFIVDKTFKKQFEALSVVKRESLAFLMQKAGTVENRMIVGKIIADCLQKNITQSKEIIAEIKLRINQ